jgi:hypothetical protein
MNYFGKTEIWVRETPNSIERLMTTIETGSQFRNVDVLAVARQAGWKGSYKTDNPLLDSKVQYAVAEDIVDGWRRNGPWPEAKFAIRQT